MTNQTRITLRNIRKELQEANIKVTKLTTELQSVKKELTETWKFAYSVIQHHSQPK